MCIRDSLEYVETNGLFFFKQKTAYEISACLVGSEMCIRDRHRPAGYPIVSGTAGRCPMSGKDPSVLLLEHHLKALKLPTILREYAGVAALCSQEHSSFAQYLLRLVERELIDRERRATERRIKEAAFPVIKTIETFDFAAQVSINEPLVRELLRGEYIS